MFTHLRKAKKFNENRAKFYAAQVYLALRYLHDLGYVYRDLKPENILFEPDGYIKISDYGLAKNLKPNEKTYSLAGTPDYVSKDFFYFKVLRLFWTKVKAFQQTGGLSVFWFSKWYMVHLHSITEIMRRCSTIFWTGNYFSTIQRSTHQNKQKVWFTTFWRRTPNKDLELRMKMI